MGRSLIVGDIHSRYEKLSGQPKEWQGKLKEWLARIPSSESPMIT